MRQPLKIVYCILITSMDGKLKELYHYNSLQIMKLTVTFSVCVVYIPVGLFWKGNGRKQMGGYRGMTADKFNSLQ